MPSDHDPADCLADILDNIERIGRYTARLDLEAFAKDDLRRDRVERCLQRICEAAFRLGAADAMMPEQPWDIRAMGNRLRHAYDRLDLNISGALYATICPA